jgi:hypothetical protein
VNEMSVDFWHRLVFELGKSDLLNLIGPLVDSD